jgi:NAD(P)-dependent dehydrogenase (short-subunit alcohol dehydrogenase family)
VSPNDAGRPGEPRFVDQVAIVTGGGSGLGEAVAVRLAHEGATVAVVDIRQEAAEATTLRITEAGGRAESWPGDVSDPDSVRATVRDIAGALGRPQVLVNCAGVGQFDLSEEVAFETWNRTIAVNLTGTFLMCQAALPFLLDGGGAIVNIASNSGLQGIPYAAAYAASKGGVILLSRSLASEFSGRGVRVNAVAPGGIITPLLENFVFPEGADPARMPRGSRVPHAHPDEIASLVAYIASDEARFMVGSVVSMDGGLTA